MDINDQFTAKSASVARRVRAFDLTDAHIWGDTEPHTYYRDATPHRNSLAAKRVHVTASPAQPAQEAATPSMPEGSSGPALPALRG